MSHRKPISQQEASLPAAKPRLAGNHAVVIGGSMAGLLAARVLSDRFQQVTLIERDRLTDTPQHRLGTPQSQHLHVLLVKGEQIISKWFPQIAIELIQAGATQADATNDVLWFQEGGYKTRFHSGIRVLFMSRALLESRIRRRVLAIENLTCLAQQTVEGLVAKGDRITGLTLRQHTTDGQQNLSADLVIDATGRRSKSPQWLEALGYLKPSESVVKINLSYTTRVFQQTPHLLSQAKGIVIMHAPPDGTRGGVLCPIEGGRWIVTLIGWMGDQAPADEQGFLDYAKSLTSPDIYNVISQAKPLGEFAKYRLTSSLRRHYEKMTRFPEGYVVMGDALCSFNPVYGQGMSVSAMEAETLESCLKAAVHQNGLDRNGPDRNGSDQNSPDKNHLNGLAQDFFKRTAALLKDPWMMAVSEDFRFPETKGKKPLSSHLLNLYSTQLHKLTQHDPVATKAFFQVVNLMQPPTVLFSPDILFRVFGSTLSSRNKETKSS